MSTILDVCKLAGVSKATVSRVINGTGQVKESTRDNVFSAMKELGYRPNRLAQALATNKTHTVGLVVSDFDGIHFGLLLKQAAASAELANKQLIVTDGHNDPAYEYEVILQLEAQCDAIVLYSRTLTDDHIQLLHKQLTIPIVVINRDLPEQLFHSVSFQQENAVTLMMNHLLTNGHKDIACITGHMNNPTGIARLNGYKNALKSASIPFQKSLLKNGHYDMKSGYQACQSLLKEKSNFTAIIAFNDCMALGALRALTEAGINVPEQVSIIGIDDDPVSEFFTPRLTTVKLPIVEMTKQAVELAITLCDESKPTHSYQYQGELIQRESVMPVKLKA
ncbi:LacI family DNA-binding transcriptional regulator [Psychromonas aquatilis]|uniref:LacI family DNA-binding transcriptional regulator n=1 Tax=Psychromonas aquatilis TaxID=2005072 RepID=A0ABU9GQH6_9GAMM